MEDKNKNKINEKADDYFEESINFSNFKSQQTKDKLNLRKNKIFNKLFAKRKENFENNIKDPNEIDINSLNCDESIKKDANYYVKNHYDIKKWFKYIFSSNKNEIYVFTDESSTMRLDRQTRSPPGETATATGYPCSDMVRTK